MATVAVSGISGDFKSDGTSVALLNKWDLTKQTTLVPIPHFQSPVDGDDLPYTEYVIGYSTASGNASGFLNVDPTDATDSGTPGLSNGLGVTADLILVRDTGWGFKSLPILIETVNFAHDFQNQAASFSCAFKVNGVCGKTSL